MPVPLNAEMLAHAYDYLACQEPFSRWNLPPSEDVRFSISTSRKNFAHYQMIGGVHHIALSRRFVGRHETLIATLAHELIHLHQEQACMATTNAHDATFHKYADKICRIHEFDRLTF
jgi:hypothetical protein